jgi:RNA polymerase sigma-70 factor (ECF subfamily)
MPEFFSRYQGYLYRFNPLRTETKANKLVIEKIRNGDKTELEVIYKSHKFEFISWLTNKFNCSEDEARDVYQFAVMTLYDNIKNEKLLELNSSVKTYLFAIGKHKILEQKKASIKFIPKLDDQIPDVPDVGKWENEMYEESLQLVEQCLEKLGEPCKTLLELYYYHSMSMEEIAERMNYKNRFTSKNLKYKCINRLRRIYIEELKKQNNKIL